MSSQGIFQFTVHRMRPLFSHSSLPPLSLDVAASNFNNTAHYSYFYPSPRLTMCKPVQLCLVPSLISLLNSPPSVFQPPIHNTALLIRLSHFFYHSPVFFIRTQNLFYPALSSKLALTCLLTELPLYPVHYFHTHLLPTFSPNMITSIQISPHRYSISFLTSY